MGSVPGLRLGPVTGDLTCKGVWLSNSSTPLERPPPALADRAFLTAEEVSRLQASARSPVKTTLVLRKVDDHVAARTG